MYPLIGTQLFNHTNASTISSGQVSLGKVNNSPPVTARLTTQRQAPQISLSTDNVPPSGALISSDPFPSPQSEAQEPNKQNVNGSGSVHFPFYYLDAEYETLEAAETMSATGASSMPDVQTDGAEEASGTETLASLKSSIDRTFQRFADRLAQNPLQVIRYEYKGFPLLYNRSDSTGKLILAARTSSIDSGREIHLPRCQNCKRLRVFEMQITPHAISRLEGEEGSVSGMEWGTIILGVCEGNCEQVNNKIGEVSHLEEWVGVQWE